MLIPFLTCRHEILKRGESVAGLCGGVCMFTFLVGPPGNNVQGEALCVWVFLPHSLVVTMISGFFKCLEGTVR